MAAHTVFSEKGYTNSLAHASMRPMGKTPPKTAEEVQVEKELAEKQAAVVAEEVYQRAREEDASKGW